MPLYIRHSCCVKKFPISSKFNPLLTLRRHYSTHFPIIQNPAIPYFISLFTVPIKLFQLFILVLLLFRILLHKKATPCSVTNLIFLFFYFKKRDNEFFNFKKLAKLVTTSFK